MRVGILGGSFDPVHLGHLWIGECATEQLQLDRLLWIPVATQPLKPGGAVASNDQRFEMLRLAVSGREDHRVDDRELKRQGLSYTVDTVAELIEQEPDSELYLIVGSDSLRTMTLWHEPQRLLSLVTLSVVQRGGDPPVDFSVLNELVDQERIRVFRDNVIEMPVIEISSSEIRGRAGQGRSIRYRVPRPVEAFINAQQLYRDQEDA